MVESELREQIDRNDGIAINGVWVSNIFGDVMSMIIDALADPLSPSPVDPR